MSARRPQTCMQNEIGFAQQSCAEMGCTYDYQVGTDLYGRWGKRRIFGNPGWKICKFQRRSAEGRMDRFWKGHFPSVPYLPLYLLGNGYPLPQIPLSQYCRMPDKCRPEGMKGYSLLFILPYLRYFQLPHVLAQCGFLKLMP